MVTFLLGGPYWWEGDIPTLYWHASMSSDEAIVILNFQHYQLPN